MSAAEAKHFRYRLYAVLGCFVIAFLAVVVKAADLQFNKREELSKKATAQFERYFDLGAVRGEIFDNQGEKLASSLSTKFVFADAALIENKEAVAASLAEILELEQEPILEKLNTNRRYILIKRPISEEEAEKIKELNVAGVALRAEHKRAYPNGELAAHLIGFVGRDGKGLEGLERSMDDYLRAGRESVKVKRDNKNRLLVDSPGLDLSPPKGASVFLTIDRRIQYIAEKALGQAAVQNNAKSGMVLVMRPKTGAILASAVWPTYDPNNYGQSDSDARRNRVLTDPFEPGSTFKVFVVAAGLEEKLINPQSVIYCENGAFKVVSHTVKDTNKYADLTVSEIIKYSSNIGSLKIGDKLGSRLLYNYLTRFTFGSQTGIEHLAAEDAGSLRQPVWHPLDAANIAFGQGVSTTALQMVMAVSSLANDGVLMQPYIIDRVVDADGQTIKKTEPHIIRQVVSPLTARQVTAMLRMAVMKGGTGTRADVAGYPVAGKTGTAQKVVQGKKGYSAGKYVASFIGFAPYHDPELCVMVVLDEPTPYYGGLSAAPVFRQIVEAALPILNVPPVDEAMGDPVWPILDQNQGGAPGVLPPGHPANFLRIKLKKNNFGPKGPIVPATVQDRTLLEADLLGGGLDDLGDGYIDLTEPPEVVPGQMPRLTGLSMRQVMEIMAPYGMELEYTGSGQVVGQNPLPGERVAEGQPGQIFLELR